VSTRHRVPREGFTAGFIRAWNAAGALKASSTIRVELSVRFLQRDLGKFSHGKFWRLTMRLSDAGLRRRPTKLIYPNHRPLLGSPKTRPRDRSNRLLEADRSDHALLRA
jgi:hypothetical protein